MVRDAPEHDHRISRDRLAELLNDDLSREYQSIIAYVVCSEVLIGVAYMDIAAQLEIQAKQELDHALIISAGRLTIWGRCRGYPEACADVDGSLWLCATLTGATASAAPQLLRDWCV